MNFLMTPIGMAAAGAAVLLVIVLMFRGKGQPHATRGPKMIEDELPEVGRLMKRGEYGRAAAVAADAGRFAAAIELYLRAQQPENAAGMAARAGNPRQAAELYERAHSWEKAAAYFEKAGLHERANEIKREKLGQLRAGVKQGEAAPATSRGKQLELEFRNSQVTSSGSEADRAKLQGLARNAADALLADGELRRAADVFRDADLLDEAVHLYVNVLGEPGLAAPILAQKGNHERAAELYELAGESERAANTWVQVAKAAARPEIFLDRIEHLSRDAATGFLTQHTKDKDITETNAEMFYRLASLLAKKGDNNGALDVYERIKHAVGPIRDIDTQIDLLRAGHSMLESHVHVHQGAPSATDAGAPGARGSASGFGSRTSAALSPEQIASLADQVARAAAEQLKRNAELQLHGFTIAPQINMVSGPLATGLEDGSLQLSLMFDPMVRQARGGPSLAQLEKYIAGWPCDLQNIEVYYRVGLVHLGQGRWQEALAAFDAVEDASPGYRDAWKRADEIRGWQSAMGPKMTQLGKTNSGDGRYQLFGELGRGGMAVVYRGHDTALDREVALKFLSESLSSEPEMREMFQREARAVAALNHPNIVTIHDVGVLEGRAFICMEFVEGKSIESLMLEPPGLTIVESLRAIKQALTGLGYAHDKKIIHRDIKPANMMRTSSGLVKLMDFGLAKSMDGQSQQSMIAGTPAYMALEQIRGEGIDHRVDLFAIGVTLYELLTGAMPYEGLDRQTPPRSLAEYVPAIPPMLEDVVMAAISNDPQARPATAAEMMVPIDEVLNAISRVAGGSASRINIDALDAAILHEEAPPASSTATAIM